MVQSIGAARAIDYTREDFTKTGQRYDLIFDCVGNHSLSASRRVLSPRGKYIQVGGPSGRWMAGILVRILATLVLARLMERKMIFIGTKPSKEDLAIVGELMQTRKITPVIDRRYSLDQLREAIGYQEQGHARGKVIITLARDVET